ncbi:MAG: UDP-N-acetylglucosamine pyrophosphorylase [Patescibacteria group bacterium]|nr:MAG: UDP-N-acetylglucosamine pyrophosphorylase [Patescibacteria group bacterium]
MIYTVILAGGKGTRMNSVNINKTALPIAGKPMIVYAVEKIAEISDKIIVVVGAYAESVKQCLKNYDIEYAYQAQQLGTADAVKQALPLIENENSLVLIGYGDHMMHYKKQTIKDLISFHKTHNSGLSLVSVTYDNPDSLGWGRVIRNSNGEVTAIVEQKDANPQERKIKELNAGFYVIESGLLKQYLPQIKPSPVTGEYYLTDLVKLAVTDNFKVLNYSVDFNEVGYGVNTPEQLKLAEQMILKAKKSES